MGAEQEQQFDLSGLPVDPRPHPGAGEIVPGGGLDSAPTSAASDPPPGASPLTPGLEDSLTALLFAWGDAYAIAGCLVAGAQVWTALRLDTAAVLTAGTAADLTALIRADYTGRPVPRRNVLRDYLLERLRARNPGWAIVTVDQGVIAVRGTTAVGPLPQRALDCALADIGVREAVEASGSLAREREIVGNRQ